MLHEHYTSSGNDCAMAIISKSHTVRYSTVQSMIIPSSLIRLFDIESDIRMYKNTYVRIYTISHFITYGEL